MTEWWRGQGDAVDSARMISGGFKSRPRFYLSTNMVHNGAMRTANKTVRQSVSLPANVAAQDRSLAKARRLSANRMLLRTHRERDGG